MKKIPLNERIIFALDVGTIEEARYWVEKLDTHVKFFKVGLQLFLAGWWPVIDLITKRGNKVMVDLKFFDIPETVRLAVAQLRDKNVTFATVHGNDPILEAAVAEKGDLKILAVTVLTSFDESDLKEMGMTGTVADLVLLRAKKAVEKGCDGVVSSGLEARPLRDRLGNNFVVVTPGIRPGINRDIEKDDQRRIVTAKEAIENGADYVVIGRPISTSQDPIAMILSLQEDIKKAIVIYDQ